MAISILENDLEEECDGNIFDENYNKYHCANCYNGIKNFSHFACQTNIFSDPQNLIKFSWKINHKKGAFTSALCDLIKNLKYCKNDADQVLNDTDPSNFNQPVIGAIKEALRGHLTSIASKLLNSEHSKLEDLSVEEQNLWTSFDNSDIYELITGEPDTLPEFQFNWIEPCQLAVHLPPGVVFASHRDLQPPPDQKNLQHHLHKSLLNLCNHLLNLRNLKFVRFHQRNWLFNYNLLQTCNPLPDQVGYNIKPTNKNSDLARISTTKNSTPASSKDAENFVAKQRPWSPSWHQDHSRQNNPLQILLLKTWTTQGHRLNLRNPLVLFPSTFYFTNEETNPHRSYLFSTRQTATMFPSDGQLCGLHLYQPHQNPIQLLRSTSPSRQNDRAHGSLHSRP
jgi:hypothetical protein